MILIDRADARPLALRQATELLRAFAHPIRLQLLAQLQDGTCGVTELVEEAQLPQPVVSRHLGVLRNAGVVRCEREGREKIYSVVDQRARPLLQLLFPTQNKQTESQEGALS